MCIHVCCTWLLFPCAFATAATTTITMTIAYIPRILDDSHYFERVLGSEKKVSTKPVQVCDFRGAASLLPGGTVASECEGAVAEPCTPGDARGGLRGGGGTRLSG